MPTLNIDVAASEDDGYELVGFFVDYTAGADNAVGAGNWQAARFQVTGPANGDTIDSAFIKYPASYTGNQNFEWRICAEDADSGADLTGPDPSGRTTTTADVNWTENQSYSTDDFIISEDIKTVIQEIIDRAGWASGNYITILMEGLSGSIFAVRYYDNPTAKTPQLEITYTAAGGGGITVAEMAAMFSPQPEFFLAPEPVGIPY